MIDRATLGSNPRVLDTSTRSRVRFHRHSRAGGNPGFFVIYPITSLDARFRGHDEPSFSPEGKGISIILDKDTKKPRGYSLFSAPARAHSGR